MDKMSAISQMIFLDEKFCILMECVPKGPNDNNPVHCIGLDNGLAPNRRQAIIWNNADPIHRRIYATLGGRWIKDTMLKCVNMYMKFFTISVGIYVVEYTMHAL